MPLKPVPRRSVTDDVFEQIAAEVVRGDVPAGGALPSERRLAEVLGVSRPSVREALAAWDMPGWSTSGRAAPPSCATSAVPPAWTCCHSC